MAGAWARRRARKSGKAAPFWVLITSRAVGSSGKACAKAAIIASGFLRAAEDLKSNRVTAVNRSSRGAGATSR